MNGDVMASKVVSEDPFNLYEILNKTKESGSISKEDDLKYPPGFTPKEVTVEEAEAKDTEVIAEKVKERTHFTSNNLHEFNSVERISLNGSYCSKRVQEGGSILDLMDELVKVGQIRSKQERYGSVFNMQGANAFNNFISLASLIDFPLDGYAFTWAHKSATKMSKLDRFLISKGLMALFPHLLALCLDKHLSDHQGFDNLVEDTWMNLNIDEPNGMIKLKKKLQALKIIIKQWSKHSKKSSYKARISIHSKLSDIDKILHQGGRNEEILNKRSMLLKELHDINSIESMEVA
ncbi:RNA-directed DNA polymerase, eukaryota [Tanacetum coccineum]|uniref:RNA-directed DNA polymerase, eukaryota n=1 Tax=Tanacetum coccineum TaxID=301880 RepID=A0ABQ4ZP36_9ASTR